MGRALINGNLAGELKKRIKLAKRHRKKVLKHIEETKKNHPLNYIDILNKKSNDKTPYEWIDHYNDYIYDCKTKLQTIKPAKNKFFLIFLALFVIFILFFTAFYLRPTIVGLTIEEGTEEAPQIQESPSQEEPASSSEQEPTPPSEPETETLAEEAPTEEPEEPSTKPIEEPVPEPKPAPEPEPETTPKENITEPIEEPVPEPKPEENVTGPAPTETVEETEQEEIIEEPKETQPEPETPTEQIKPTEPAVELPAAPILLKNIPDIEIQKNSYATIDITKYFQDAEQFYTLQAQNIFTTTFDNTLQIQPEKDFTGTRTSKIIASNEFGITESNFFDIIVSELINKPILIKNIPDINIEKNSYAEINLVEYFENSDIFYSLQVPGILTTTYDHTIKIQPEQDFAGERQIKIIASNEFGITESNSFDIIVSETGAPTETAIPKVLTEEVTQQEIIPTIENLTEENATILTQQYTAIIGQPVKWKKTIKLDKQGKIKIKLPKEAENIKVNKLTEPESVVTDSFSEEEVLKEESPSQKELPPESKENITKNTELVINKTEEKEESKKQKAKATITGGITGMTTADSPTKSRGFFSSIFNLIVSLFRNFQPTITGQAITEQTQETSEAIEVTIDDTALEYEITYETPAPQASEEQISHRKKKITISGPEQTHYKNILAFTQLSSEVEEEKIKLYRTTGGIRELTEIINYTDANNNGLVESVYWIVPSLSNQTYELEIIIIDAEHLNQKKEFVANIYEEVNQTDSITYTIPKHHYVRAYFEKNLTSKNYIDIVTKNNKPATIEVYEKNSDIVVGILENVTSGAYYINLNHSGNQNIFDLKSVGNNIVYDYIHDAQPNPNVFTSDVTESDDPVDQGTIVTFTGTATGYPWRIVVCSGGSTITCNKNPTSGTCSGTLLCQDTADRASGDPSSCTYDTSTDEGEVTWIAFACNDNGDEPSDGGNATNSPLTVNVADNTSPNVTINTPTNTTYGTQTIDFNVTAQDNSLMYDCWYSLDGAANVSMFNNTATIWNYTDTSVAEGSHKVVFACNDSSNNFNSTESKHFSIDLTAPNVTSLTETPTDGSEFTLTQGYEFNVTVLDSTEVDTVLLDFNGTNYTATNLGDVYNITLTGLSAGVHWYTWCANDTLNNLNCSQEGTYTIEQNSSYILSLTGTSQITYGTAGDFQGAGCPSQLTCNLFRNQSLNTVWTNLGDNQDTAVLGSDNYTYVYNTTGNANYTSNTTIFENLEVLQGTGEINGTINGIQENFTEVNGSATQNIFINATNITGYGTGRIYVNGTLHTTGAMPIFNSTNLSIGFYNITFKYDGNQNYTNDTDIWWVNVTAVTNTAPDDPSPDLVSVDGTNSSATDLNCSAIITDPDTGNLLNVTVRWYNNSVLDSEINYNNNYANGTRFNATLDSANTTAGEIWNCSIQVFDGTVYSNWVNSSKVTILNTAPNITYVANNTPTIIAISDNGPNEAPAATYVVINFTAYDLDGASELNDSTALVNITGDTVRQNTSCAKTQSAGYYANYTCNITMWWWDASMQWNITAFILDNQTNAATNSSAYFYVGKRTAFTISPAVLNWSGISPGATNQTSNNDPIILNNTGNNPIAIDEIGINATNLLGEQDNNYGLWAGNFSVATFTSATFDECNETATTMNASIYTNITGASLPKGNHTIGDGTAQEQLYFCLRKVGSELTALEQAYSTSQTGAWSIRILLVAFSLSKKKKSKKKKKQKTIENLTIPSTIFSNKKLGCLEAMVKYMKENLEMSYHEIAKILNRDDRTIWTAYKKAIEKQPGPISLEKTMLMLPIIKVEKIMIILPVSIFKNKKLTTLEAIIKYLKQKGQNFSEISKLLNRDQRNIWTIYSKAVRKK